MAGSGKSGEDCQCMATKWEELSGLNNWENLLEPLDIDLRRSILNYGDRAAATGDAFNVKWVEDCKGVSRFPPKDFFKKLGVTTRNPFKYVVTDFIYSKLSFKNKYSCSTWCAYVAVSTNEGKELLGRRDILVAWDGSVLLLEDIIDVDAQLVSASDILTGNDNAMVHSGFHSIYTNKDSDSTYARNSAREQVLAAVRKLVDQYRDETVSITITGHSLGAALATLNAMDITANGYNMPTNEVNNKTFPVTAIVFGSPRVGNKEFARVYDDELNDVHILRVTNHNDLITILPPYDYQHVGVKLLIDASQSPYLKEVFNPHNLDIYLHGVAGTQGTNGGFNLEVDRDVALINKASDYLNTDYNNGEYKYVPPNWWTLNQEINKGMVLNDDGTYSLDSYVPDPPPPTA